MYIYKQYEKGRQYYFSKAHNYLIKKDIEMPDKIFKSLHLKITIRLKEDSNKQIKK
jgi:hypothetical protein